ncbi:MAG: Rid family hydrolase [Pirellulaceae bacterium]
MNPVLMTWQPASLQTHCACDKARCNGDVVIIPTKYAKEIYIRWNPTSIDEDLTSPSLQAESYYRCLRRILENAGASMSQVVQERVFFRDVEEGHRAWDGARRRAYGQAGVEADDLPVANCVGQPPCRLEQAFEIQAYAVVPNSEDTANVSTIPAEGSRPAVKIVEFGEYRHLYTESIVGQKPDGQIPTDFREQSDLMFQRADDLLKHHGIPFKDVLRTWCYLVDIDGDYAEFNLSRNELFERESVRRLPASTGICAGLPRGALCGFDLYTLINHEGAHIEVMHTPTLNEAGEYGSAFSRGMKLVLPEKTVLFISGTASVDEGGATVHLDDIRKQIERMLLNIEKLLEPHGATFADMAQAMTYLKKRSYYETFLDVWKDWGPEETPNSIVEAGVCRPDLLCEMEAIVILPTGRE